ncbi:unnamed protein product [Ascophyllum nodosum]
MPYPNLISGIGWFILGVKVQGFLAPCVPSDRAFSVSMRTSVGCRRCTRAFPTQWMSRAVADSRSLQLSVRETAVDADVGPTKEEGHAVLDALIEQFASPENGNVTATVDEYLDLCDHAFLTHLRSRIASVGSESSTGMKLSRVEEEINMAMERRLAAANSNLRRVLELAPDIKGMEGKVRILFREGKVDMAFMVVINMNLQRAKEAEGAENAVKILTHMTTFIMGLQNEGLNPELRLLRLLLRTDCDGVRKSMLQEQLQLTHHDIFVNTQGPPMDKNRVQPDHLRAAITDMISQLEELGQAADAGLTDFLRGLQVEIDDVVKSNQRPGPFRQ